MLTYHSYGDLTKSPLSYPLKLVKYYQNTKLPSYHRYSTPRISEKNPTYNTITPTVGSTTSTNLGILLHLTLLHRTQMFYSSCHITCLLHNPNSYYPDCSENTYDYYWLRSTPVLPTSCSNPALPRQRLRHDSI